MRLRGILCLGTLDEGPVQTFPAIAAVARFASLDTLSCRPDGSCTGTGTYMAAEKNRTWAAARPFPGIAALNTGQVADLGGLVCFSADTCTVAGGYSIQRKNHTVAAILVTPEKRHLGQNPRHPAITPAG